MAGLGPQELLLIFALAFLFFGAKKIPEVGRGIGQGIKELRNGLGEAFKEDDE